MPSSAGIEVLDETALCRLVTASFNNLFSTVNFMWISSPFLRGFVVLFFCLAFGPRKFYRAFWFFTFLCVLWREDVEGVSLRSFFIFILSISFSSSRRGCEKVGNSKKWLWTGENRAKVLRKVMWRDCGECGKFDFVHRTVENSV